MPNDRGQNTVPASDHSTLDISHSSFGKPLLEARGLTKKFPGVTALRDVAFDLHAGEVHALCGENGAGKSTLIKLLSGIHPHGSYVGELLVDGRTVAFHSIRAAEAAGIAVITQEFALVDELSVAENIFLGRAPTGSKCRNAPPRCLPISASRSHRKRPCANSASAKNNSSKSSARWTRR